MDLRLRIQAVSVGALDLFCLFPRDSEAIVAWISSGL